MTRLWMSYSLEILFASTDWGEKKDFLRISEEKSLYLYYEKITKKYFIVDASASCEAKNDT